MQRDPQSFGLVTDSPAQQNATPVSLLRKAELAYFIDRLDTADQTWLARQNFTANSSDVAWLSDGSVVCGWSGTNDLSSLGHLPLSLPAGIYQLTHAVSDLQLLGWALGSYQFTRYKPATREAAEAPTPVQSQPPRVSLSNAASTERRSVSMQCRHKDCAEVHRYPDGFCHLHRAQPCHKRGLCSSSAK